MRNPRDELVDEVAVRIARNRLNVPICAYDKAEVHRMNALGWAIEFHPERVSLTPEELELAWMRSDTVLRAWA